jgi:hypothetical protein
MRKESVMKRILAGSLSLALAVPTAAAVAQEPPEVTPGTRVRISAPTVAKKHFVGTITAWDPENLTMTSDKGPIVLPRGAVSRLELSRGRKSRGRKALLGAGIGAAAGALVGFAHGSDPPGSSIVAFDAGTYALTFGALGAAAGALIGVAITPGERWEELPPTRFRVSVGPVRGHGLGVSLTMAFGHRSGASNGS